jgi:calcineurin-like phosphoesterase family protein
MIWFTSDHHFGHENIIKFCDRPFKNVAEMDSRLTGRWNNVVSINDTVYHLGDFVLGGIDQFVSYASQLNGQIKILPGSHDHRWLAGNPQNVTSWPGHPIEVLPPLVSLKFPELGDGQRPQTLVLCHYAMRVWNKSHFGAWHLYGHSHNKLPSYGLSFDVGVDCTDFRPISLDEVAERMSKLTAVGLVKD